MKPACKTVVLIAMSIGAASHALGWSVKSSDKTHVRVQVVDEDRKPVAGQKMTFFLGAGGGPERSFVSDADGMVSFRDKVVSYADCEFDIDRKLYYPVCFEYRAYQSGSVVTGVVKRIAKPSQMVDMYFRWNISNAVHKIGMDLLLGDLVAPYGKGKCADLYLMNEVWRDESITVPEEKRKLRTAYWFERGGAGGEFTVVPRDVGCELPTPAVAPETMLNNSYAKFENTRRHEYDVYGWEDIGEEKFVLFRVVRPNGAFYGVIIGGASSLLDERSSGGLTYCINPNPRARDIAWVHGRNCGNDWRRYVAKAYADAEKAEEGGATAKTDTETLARNRKMMEENAYSGTWRGKAWGMDSVTFRFDKCGLGCFEFVHATGVSIFASHESSGWFYWTSDGGGAITAHAVGSRYGEDFGPHDFRMKYDCEKNMMSPDLESELFSGRIAPLVNATRCELGFISGDGIKKIGYMYDLGGVNHQQTISKHDARMMSLPKSTMATFSELWKTARKRCADGTGIALRKVGAPEIRVIGKDDGMRVYIQEFARRSGDMNAPQFKILEGMYGPDISGKKSLELFYKNEDMRQLEKSFDVDFRGSLLKDEGAWTKEFRDFSVAIFEKGEIAKCQKLLKEVVEKWYTFPVRVIELDEEKK